MSACIRWISRGLTALHFPVITRTRLLAALVVSAVLLVVVPAIANARLAHHQITLETEGRCGGFRPESNPTLWGRSQSLRRSQVTSPQSTMKELYRERRRTSGRYNRISSFRMFIGAAGE